MDHTGIVVAQPYVPRLSAMFDSRLFPGGLDVTSPRCFVLMLAAALTIASSSSGQAQIINPFPPYRYPNTYPDASVRLDVTPRDTEVYVDGFYAGIVDDFDGMLQRLRVEPGQHEITLYHDGYRAVHQRVYLTRDRTFKIKQQMEKLPAGDVAEPRPIPAPLPAGAQPPVPLPRDGRGAPPNLPPQTAPSAGNSAPASAAGTGRLTIQVQPADATVLIDGQPWPASPGQSTVVLDLSEGRHVVQVRKPGYVGYLTEVEVRPGETATVKVTLRTQP
jgi:hypothetical protein